MAMHAKSGGNLEIMGMLQGKIIGDTFIILGAQRAAQRPSRCNTTIAA